ncbi:DNA polymerase I [Buchnera aphidicola]|uniref:DNA polymerase I n=1 Tax=Buchnera aphidicola subsp. Cinara cedri (strain Cc) TaxID=372461 RepID=Q057H2_BUCCC|nr:DNA polymerase I [Buchnera aphidicola]ABJ90727.1 5'-3' exonuclease domain of DNA polymerase I [Buchnera aphidicola BCc]
MKKKIIIIDGHYCLYQNYFSFIKLKNKNGSSTGVLYGYIRLLNKLIEKFNPKKIIIVFDTPKKTNRHKLFTKYKKNRISMPNELKKQINPLKKIIKALNITIISIKKIEADDIIGTISRIFTKKKYYIFIYSADKDMTQLIKKNVFVIPGSIKKVLNKNDIFKKYGVYPKSIADFLCLVGDFSDNIRGVLGIGKKTAKILLQSFSSIKKIYKNIEKISFLPIKNIKNIKKNLEKNKKNTFLSYQLTKINKNIELPKIHSIIKKNTLNIEFIKKKFEFYQLNEYLKKINDNTFSILNIYNKKKKMKKKHKYIEIVKKKILLKLINKIIKKKIFAISIYEKKKNEKKKKFYLSITIEKHETWWFIYKKKKNISIKKILKYLRPILENNKYYKIGKNLKNVFHIFQEYNILFRGIHFDTTIINYYYKLNYKKNKKYQNLIYKYKKNKKEKSFKRKFIIMQESLISLKIYFLFKKNIKKKKRENFQLIDMSLLPILAEIENNGVLIKKKILKKQKKNHEKTLKKLKKKIFKITKEKFNINSSKQLQNILFKKFNLPKIYKTKLGNISTNEIVLKKLSKIHILPKIILQFRLIKKIINTYLRNLIKSINNKTNRIHTTYNQINTSTGRLSSKNPNLQNIPIKTKIGRKLRIAFITKKKWLLLTADYSHIELRIIAHYSKDKNLIKDLLKNKDIHISTASHIFNKPLEKIKKYHRNIAKTINFSILYGISPFGLSKKLNISIKKSKNLIYRYFLKYNKIKRFIKNTYKTAKKRGYIKTLFKRKLYIPNINSKNIYLKNSAKRFCINLMIQNTASDIIKKSMITLHHLFKKKFPKDIKIIMQIHDELIFEIKEKKKDKIIDVIKKIMENNTKLIIPLYITTKIGKNWKEIKSI